MGGGCTVERMRSYPSTIEDLSHGTKIIVQKYTLSFTSLPLPRLRGKGKGGGLREYQEVRGEWGVGSKGMAKLECHISFS